MHPSIDIRAWPTLSTAARMLGVAPSTLSQRDDLAALQADVLEKRISPGTVIRLARLYRRRVVDEVGFDLVAYAAEHAPDLIPAVRDEIDRALATAAPPSDVSAQAFLDAAEAYLPPELYELVLKAAMDGGLSRGVAGAEPIEGRT